MHNLTFDIYENINTHQNRKNTEKGRVIIIKNYAQKIIGLKCWNIKKTKEKINERKKNYINDSEEESESIN